MKDASFLLFLEEKILTFSFFPKQVIKLLRVIVVHMLLKRGLKFKNGN